MEWGWTEHLGTELKKTVEVIKEQNLGARKVEELKKEESSKKIERRLIVDGYRVT